MKTTYILSLLFLSVSTFAQQTEIPASYSNIHYDKDNHLYFEENEKKYFATDAETQYSTQRLLGKPTGTSSGVILDFGNLKGSVTYGLIPYGKAPHPLPVYRFTQALIEGKAEINMADAFKYPYDFVGWKENGFLTLGYRVTDNNGMILFDGVVSLSGTGPFEVLPAVYEGPFVSNLTDTSVVIWCKTTLPVQAQVEIDGRIYKDNVPKTHHEWQINSLKSNQKYQYKVTYGLLSQSYHVTTALKKGSRQSFIFGYTSDSRHATGGGERKAYGANAYIMKKIAALAYKENAAFVQFTGDMINGYLSSKEEQHLQYTNWKKSIEPFWHYMPFNVGMGNHEALGYVFEDESGKNKGFIDRFPFETESAETVFAEAFVNPISGLISEDDNKYDPDKKRIDFPPYAENVFYYTFGNTAMVVLNSNYWYAPSLSKETATSGGLHGYIMDNQLDWLRATIQKLENDKDIDHIFITQHTPAFPNGGHSKDDMWYSGDNTKRPWIGGKPVEKGIIERRDEYLDILINESKKTVAILTGDEHNYNWLKLTQEVPIYPADYPSKKLNVSRSIYQINNGAAGAPYYAQEVLPWSKFTQSFSVENALCLFYVNGKRITMKVYNPDTLNLIDELEVK